MNVKAILFRLGLPITVGGAFFAGLYLAESGGWIPNHVAFWLWPSLIALILAAGAVIALLKGARAALIPLAVGFVVQLIGIILLLVRTFESRWEPLWYTLGAIGLVLLVMGIIWLVNTLRARALERGIAAGLGPDEGTSAQELERIRQDMLGALDLLKRAGRGRNAIYDLPWLLVMGRPAAGKSVAIKESGLGLPVRKDWVKGVGGTYTADWFFTNEMIFIDTPGKWVIEGADSDAADRWMQLIRLLRKYRTRQPLDGLIVVVPADDLLSKSAEELEEQAANIREIVDLIHSELSFRFPVYVLVSKCDLVKGFIDFFRGIPARRRHEILGWSNDDPNRKNVGRLITGGFAQVQRRLEAYRLEMLAREASRSKARKLFFFAEEFKELQDPLITFTESLFREDRFHDTPVFRGFYFSSGTQGEGSPLSRAMPVLAKALGVTMSRAEQEEDVPKRSYFLLDLFRDLIVKDDGLVSRTAVHWWKRRRNTMLGAFAPAGVALLVLLLSLTSLLLNRGLYYEVAREGPAIEPRLLQLQGEPGTQSLQAALGLTERLRDYHRELAGFSLFRGFGMRRPKKLADDALDLFRQGFEESVLRPTLSAAEGFATDAQRECAPRLEILHSVVWLRMGRRAESFNDLAGFDRVWAFPEHEREQAANARETLLRQYGYYKTRIDADEAGTLLPGFSLRKVAQSLKDDCSAQGATSTLEMYRRFQEDCRSAEAVAAVQDCYRRLAQVWSHNQADYDRFVRRFGALKEDLSKLENRDEPEARIALELLDSIDLAEAGTGECLTRFEQKVIPEIRTYADRDDFLEACQEKVRTADEMGKKFQLRNEILAEQEQQLKPQEDDLKILMANYSSSCFEAIPGFKQLEFDVLKNIAFQDRRARCLPVAVPRAPTPAPTVARATTPAPSPSRRRTVQFQWFENLPSVAGAYTPQHWEYKRQDWAAQMQSAEVGFSPEQRAAEEGRIRGEIRSYASSYVGAWTRYLSALELSSQRPGVAEWLAGLSTTQDYAKALSPAAQAAGLGDSTAEAPFDAMAVALQPLASVQAFLEAGLGQYQATLGMLAQDLRRCQQDNNFFRTYRERFRSGNPDNNLIRARQWVQLHGGTALAGGALQGFLLKPIEAAQGFVQSDSLLRGMWSDLSTLYAEQIAGRAPFSGEIDAENQVTAEALVALLGRKTGLVARVRAAAGASDLSAAAEAWLSDAEALAEVFFDPDSDEIKPVRVRLTIGARSIEPEDLGDKFRVERIHLYFGEGSDFEWKEGDVDTKNVRFVLFGDERMEYSWVRATVAEKKGLIGRTVGGNWKEGESMEAVSAQGFWAPLRVVAGGLPAGAPVPASGTLALEYKVTIPLKHKTAQAVLAVEASGSALPNLLRLMREGLPSPPSGLS